jgi:signal transduction histidine kinase
MVGGMHLERRISRAAPADGLLVLATAVVVLGGSPHAARLQVPDRDPIDGVGYLLLWLAVAGLLPRRRLPLVALAVTVGATSVYLAIGYPYGPVLFTMGLATYAVASRFPLLRSLAASLLALAVALPAALYSGLTRPTAHADGWLFAWPAWLLLPWTVGAVVRLRREAVARDRAEDVRRGAYEERLRVAREVHDVVGHGLAVINMQAGIALHVLDRRPEQARVALAAVKQTSKDALAELRATLAVFREPTDDPETGPREPVPGLAQLEALVGAMREAGLPVELTRTGDPADLPAVVDHAAYRIVQESLTNVLRHALPARARVWLRYQPRALTVKVTDDGSPVAAGEPGHGIAGMRERAVAVGGTLSAGPLPGRGFQVTAQLPIGEDS